MTTPSSKTAVITGGLGDIGSAICRDLAKDGFDLVVIDLVDNKAGTKKAATLVAGTQQRVDYYCADQTGQQAVKDVLARHPQLDVVVITAAIVTAQPFLEIDLGAWDKQIQVNLTGSFIVAQAAAQQMVASGRPGHVIFVSSWVSERPWPEITAYSVSKAGLNHLMRQMALELAASGVRANAVAPGIVLAGLAKHQLETEPAYAARVATAIPLGTLQTAEDISQTVRYLASPAASSMTGTVLTIDGGCSLGQIT
jgi:NAD(P)-dependent dehydrogenase (short-subunit alcohol dehydrogenase family)